MVELLNICEHASGKALPELLLMYVSFYLHGAGESFKSAYQPL